MMKWGLLLLAGGIGTISRYWLANYVGQALGPRFPYGTFFVNAVGCFLIGVFAAIAESKFAMSANTRIILMAGFLGAFTTFSTFIYETMNLMKDGQLFLAVANIFLSVLAGCVVFYFGFLLGELV